MLHAACAELQASKLESQLAAAAAERRRLEDRAAELEAELEAAQQAQRAPAEAEGRAAELEAQLGEARAAAEKVGRPASALPRALCRPP
jgi:predicted RNase H-like nuclease (RuvC/YqgF family)